MEELYETSQKILLDAYCHYLKENDPHFTFKFESQKNIPDVTHAIHQLHRKKYIHNVSTYLTLDAVVLPILSESISFSLTIDGIALAETYWESQSDTLANSN